MKKNPLQAFIILVVSAGLMYALYALAVTAWQLYVRQTEMIVHLDNLNTKLDGIEAAIKELGASQKSLKEALVLEKKVKDKKILDLASYLRKRSAQEGRAFRLLETQTRNVSASMGSLEGKTKRWVNDSVIAMSSLELGIRSLNDKLTPVLDSRLPQLEHAYEDLYREHMRYLALTKSLTRDLDQKVQQLREDVTRQQDQVLDVIAK